MSKRPLNPNRSTANMELVVIKEQLEDVKGKVSELVILLGGSEVGPTHTPGLISMVSELQGKLSAMIRDFQHAEKWRKDYKSALADNEARAEKRREQREQREYEAAQERARHQIEIARRDDEIQREKRRTINRTILAAVGTIAGFIAKELYQHYFA